MENVLNLLNSVKENKDAFDFIVGRFTIKELKSTAKELAIKGYSKLKKAELIKIVTNAVYGIEVNDETKAVALLDLDKSIYTPRRFYEDAYYETPTGEYVSLKQFLPILEMQNRLKIGCLHLPYNLKSFMHKLIDKGVKVWSELDDHKQMYVQLLRSFHGDTADKSNTELFMFIKESYDHFISALEY